MSDLLRPMTWLEAQQRFLQIRTTLNGGPTVKHRLSPVLGCIVHPEARDGSEWGEDLGDLDVIGGWWITTVPSKMGGRMMHMWPDRQPAYRSDR